MRRISALLLAALCAVALAGCASGPRATEDPSCPDADAPLTSLTIAADPRAVTGGTTACISSVGIEKVSDTTAPVVPVTVTDSEGTRVEITDASRILPIDISGTIAATVFALGLGDKVVGKDASTTFAGTENLPVVTNAGHTLNAEAIIQLAPTVVLTDTSIGPKEVRQQLRDAGIPVVVVSSERRIDNVDEVVNEVAAALGVPSRGDALNRKIAADVDAAVAEVAAVAPADPEKRPRVLFLYVRGSANIYYLFGRESGADSLIDAVGGVDVATEIGWQGMRPMNAEALAAAQPDVLLMMTDGLASVGGIDGLVQRIPAIAQTPAGQHGRVVDMADTQILSFGPRTAEVIRAVARALYAPESVPTPAPTT